MKHILGPALLLFSATLASAQAPGVNARKTMLAEATRLAGVGEIAASRALIDSLAKVTPREDSEFAEVLLARAALASSDLDAGLDYEKILSDFTAADVRREALLRLAQRALISGDTLKALGELKQLTKEFPDDTWRAMAGYWRARVLFESHDVLAACAANGEAALNAKASSSPLLREIEAQGLSRCPQAPTVALVDSFPKTIARAVPPAISGRNGRGKTYAVQVSAFASRNDAEAMAARLKKSGLDAHVDGVSRPFRVRVGHYGSYAEAAKALRDLKTRKLSGFVAEIGS
jgi:cell division septation protein DedD